MVILLRGVSKFLCKLSQHGLFEMQIEIAKQLQGNAG